MRAKTSLLAFRSLDDFSPASKGPATLVARGDDNSRLGNPQPPCSGPIKFSREEAHAAIKKFCADSRWTKQVIVPLVSFGHGTTSDGRIKTLGVTDSYPINNGADNLWLGVSFAEDNCMGYAQFNTDKCEEYLGQALDRCGGQSRKVCMVYRITARPKGDPKPLTLKSTDRNQIGQFTCKDTDVSALKHPGSLAGTCTCWYSGLPSVTDVFDKPSSGKCADVRYDTDPQLN